MRYTVNSYFEVLEKAETLMAQVQSLSSPLTLRSGRYKSYFNTVRQVDDAIKNDGIDEYLLKNNQKGEVFFALKQLSEMSMIFEHLLPLLSTLHGDNRNNLLERFSLILDGPTYPSEETKENNKARNYQFELLVAARFKQSGYSDIGFFRNPDVLVHSNGRPYPIECKRIFGNSESSILKRVKEAVGQLNDHPIKDSIGGVIALDMSRKYEGSSNVLESRSLQSAEDFIMSQLEQDMLMIQRRSQAVQRATASRKLVAMFTNLSGVYVIPSTKQFGWVHELAVTIFNKEYPDGAAIFMDDLKKLQSVV